MPQIIRVLTPGSTLPVSPPSEIAPARSVVRILEPACVHFQETPPTSAHSNIAQQRSFPATSDPFKLAAYERGVGFPSFRDRGFWDLTYPAQMAVDAHFKAHPRGTWINLGTRGTAQADFANQAVGFAMRRGTEIPSPRLIAIDREPENERISVAEPASFEFIRGDINDLASLLPAEIEWSETLVTDSFAGIAYGNPTEVLANILNALPEGVCMTVTLGDTRVRLPDGTILPLAAFLKDREGFEVVQMFSPFQEKYSPLARSGYAMRWNPEEPPHIRQDYEQHHHLHGFTVKRTSGRVGLPRLKLVEILDAYDYPKPRLFEVIGD